MKPSEIRELTDEELLQAYDERTRELFNIRVQQETSQAENPVRIRILRREVARIQTIMTERRAVAAVGE